MQIKEVVHEIISLWYCMFSVLIFWLHANNEILAFIIKNWIIQDYLINSSNLFLTLKIVWHYSTFLDYFNGLFLAFMKLDIWVRYFFNEKKKKKLGHSAKNLLKIID